MAAYIIARMNVEDAATYDRYKAQTPAVVAQFGGRFVVRGGRYRQLEGDDRGLDRIVVLEFDSYERAEAFYGSEAYQAILGLRLAAARSESVLVDGG